MAHLTNDLGDRPGIVLSRVGHAPAAARAVLADLHTVLAAHLRGEFEADLGRFDVGFKFEDLRPDVAVVAEQVQAASPRGPLDRLLGLAGADRKAELRIQDTRLTEV